MNDMQPRAARENNAKGVLYLQFRIQEQRFALSVHEVIEVLPRQPLADRPGAWLGRGRPCIPWPTGAGGRPGGVELWPAGRATHQYPAGAGALSRWPAAWPDPEQATETLRCHPDEFQPYGVDSAEAAYLGPVRQDEQGLLQRIEVNDLLPDVVHQLLYPGEPTGMPT